MIRRASEHAARQLRPGFERLAPLDELGQRGRQLPDPAHPIARSRRRERHLLQVLGLRLVVVQTSGRRNGIPKRRMLRVIADARAVDENPPAVAQAVDVLLAVFHHALLTASCSRSPWNSEIFLHDSDSAAAGQDFRVSAFWQQFF